MVRELDATLLAAGLPSFEIIVIDDGSRDGTAGVLAGLEGTRLRVLTLAEGPGKSAALAAGMAAAHHELVATMDGDGQDDPRELCRLLSAIDGGAELAIGVRVARQSPWTKRAASRVANAVRRLVLRDPFRDIGCPLRAFRTAAVAFHDGRPGGHRFFPYHVWNAGLRVVQLDVSHRPRVAGRSKYGNAGRLGESCRELLRLWRLSPRGPRPTGGAAALLAVAFLAAGLWTLRDYGFTRDGLSSLARARTTRQVLRSLVTGEAADTRELWHMGHPALAPTLASFVAGAIELPFGLDRAAAYNATFVAVAALAVWLVFVAGRRMLGEGTGLLAALLLALHPRFFAYAHFGHKEIPILAAGVVALAAIHRASLPGAAPRASAEAGGVAGLCASLHLWGLLFLPLHLGAQLLARRDAGPAARDRRPIRSLALFLAAASTVFIATNPILWVAPSRSLASMGKWAGKYWPYQEWYLGELRSGIEMPWHYTSVQLLAATPLLHVGAFAAGVAALLASDRRSAVAARAVLLPAILLPLGIESIPVFERYDGIRHVMVVLPALSLVAARGIAELWRRLAGPGRALLAGLVAVGLGASAREMAALHPYQECYVNELARLGFGDRLGRSVSLGDTETPLRESAEWLRRNAEPGPVVIHEGFLYASLFDVPRGTSGPTYVVCASTWTERCARQCPSSEVVHRVTRYGTTLLTIRKCPAPRPPSADGP